MLSAIFIPSSISLQKEQVLFLEHHGSDEVNALLNYGYAILESEVRKTINAVGLDPAVGYPHEVVASKTPLVYDVQELFRWLVDLSVLRLLEEKRLRKSDFIVTENYHMRLKEQTAKMLIERISINFNRTARYKGKNHTYQTILLDNAQHLANSILGRQKTLALCVPTVSINRADTLELQKRILSISPQESRRLGINKSTLGYQKKTFGKREGNQGLQ